MNSTLRTAVLAVVILALTSVRAFALVHNWSQQYAGTSAQSLSAVAIDASGNIYAAGLFYNSTSFGGPTRSSAGGSDIVLVKFNSAGVWQWDRTFGDASDTQFATGVGVDAVGNVYIGGTFMGAVNFGGGVLTSLGDRDLFVAKFNSAGTYVWAKRYGDAAEQEGQGLTVDIGTNVYFTGYFKGSVDFGGGALVCQGVNDAFLVKLDTAGSHIWSKRFGDSADQLGVAVATDHWGNIDLGMTFMGTIDVGSGNVTSAGNFDVEVVQYGAAGNYQWDHRYGDAGNQQVKSIATQYIDGYPYITGMNTGVMDFGGGPITSAGGFDVFLAKLDCFGNHLWSAGWGDAANQQGLALAVDGLGDVYLAGTNEGAMNLGGGPITSAGNQDIFLGVFSQSGVHQWSHGYGDPAKFQIPASLAVDNDYNVVMCGQFQGTVDFGGGPLTGADLDAFLVSFGPDATGVRTPIRHTEALWAAPNPFNPLTVVHYSVQQPSHVRVDIFDARGARVATLVNRDLHAGTFTATWNGVDERGSPVSSGVYFARLTAGAAESRVKLVLLK